MWTQEVNPKNGPKKWTPKSGPKRWIQKVDQKSGLKKWAPKSGPKKVNLRSGPKKVDPKSGPKTSEIFCVKMFRYLFVRRHCLCLFLFSSSLLFSQVIIKKIQENNGTHANIQDTCVIENIRTRRHHFIARLYIMLARCWRLYKCVRLVS